MSFSVYTGLAMAHIFFFRRTCWAWCVKGMLVRNRALNGEFFVTVFAPGAFTSYYCPSGFILLEEDGTDSSNFVILSTAIVRRVLPLEGSFFFLFYFASVWFLFLFLSCPHIYSHVYTLRSMERADMHCAVYFCGCSRRVTSISHARGTSHRLYC